MNASARLVWPNLATLRDTSAPLVVDLDALCGPGSAATRKKRWESALSSEATATASSLCGAALAADTQTRDAFGASLVMGLEASLDGCSTSSTASACQTAVVLMATLAHLVVSLPAAGVVALHGAALTALASGVRRLLESREVGGEPRRAICAALEALAAHSPTKRQLSKPAVESIASYLLAEQATCASILRLVSRSALVHEGVAGAVADGLCGDRQSHALELLSMTAHRMARVAADEPAAAMACMGLLQVVGNREPGVLAAGFECRVMHECFAAASAALPARQQAAAGRVALSFVGAVLEALPTTLLDEGSRRQAADLLLVRSTDGEANINTRAHALGSLATLLEGGGVFRAEGEAAAEYVKLCEALLDMLATDARASKQLRSRCVAALDVALRCNPWESTLDLAALEADALPSSLPQPYCAWLRAVHESFETVLDAAAELHQLLLTMRLGAHHLSMLLRRLLVEADAAEALKSEGGAKSASAATAAPPSALAGLRAVLRTQLHVDDNGVASCFASCACRLVELAHGCSADECARLIRAIGLSEQEHREITPALLAEAASSAPHHRMAALSLLAHCAHCAPRAVIGSALTLGWIEREADTALTRAAEADAGLEPLEPLMRLMASALQLGATCQHNLCWLRERAATAMRAGALEATAEAVFSYPLPLAQAVMVTTLDELHRDARGDVDVACVLVRTLGEAAQRAARPLWAETRSELRRQSTRQQVEGEREEGDEYDYMVRGPTPRTHSSCLSRHG